MNITPFTRPSKKDKDGNLKVFLRVNFNGKRFLVYTGITSPGELEGTIFPKTDINRVTKKNRLDAIMKGAEEILLKNHDMPANRVKPLIMALINPSKIDMGSNLVQKIEKFANTKSGRTVELYEQTARRVSEFDNIATLSSVDSKWLRDFEKYCAKTMKTNTIAIHMRNIRAVFNWCILEEETNNYPFSRFKIRHEKTAKRSLSVEQLRQLRDFPCEEFQKPYRDIFMLMFYLIGINAVDLLNLTERNIVGDRIEYVRAKTGKNYSIKVEPEAMEIINRYRGTKHLIDPLDRFKNHLDWLHHFNDGLKTIGKTYRNGCKPTGKELFPNISSYWSRHTWGTLAAEIDTPIDVIAHALGHSIPGLDVTSIYIRFNEKKVDAANRAVIDFVNSQ